MNDPSDLIKQTLAPLEGERETLSEQREQLKAQLDQIDIAIKRINRLLITAGIEQAPKRPATNSDRDSHGNRYISKETLDHARASLPDRDFTVRDLGELMQNSEGTARKAIDTLRSSGELRLMGRKPTPSGHNAIHYRKREQVSNDAAA